MNRITTWLRLDVLGRSIDWRKEDYIVEEFDRTVRVYTYDTDRRVYLGTDTDGGAVTYYHLPKYGTIKYNHNKYIEHLRVLDLEMLEQLTMYTVSCYCITLAKCKQDECELDMNHRLVTDLKRLDIPVTVDDLTIRCVVNRARVDEVQDIMRRYRVYGKVEYLHG